MRSGTRRTSRRGLILLPVLALFAATWTGSTSADIAVGSRFVKPTQQLVALLSTHEAFAKPSGKSTPLGRVQARRPLTSERTVLPVLGSRVGWLHVRLPGRPNSHTGWIRAGATALRTTPWYIVVQKARRRVTVYRLGRAVRVFKAIVGKPSTPTPRGEFFVEESVQLRPRDIGGPFALALSARSNVLQEYKGGPGQIAVHGLDNIGGVLGTAVSHGCIRVADAAMRWLVAWGRVGPGVPVTVIR